MTCLIAFANPDDSYFGGGGGCPPPYPPPVSPLPRNAISCILSIQICSELMLSILVFEIKEKNAQKLKKIITNNLSSGRKT
jgi:hypothetical protein